MKYTESQNRIRKLFKKLRQGIKDKRSPNTIHSIYDEIIETKLSQYDNLFVKRLQKIVRSS